MMHRILQTTSLALVFFFFAGSAYGQTPIFEETFDGSLGQFSEFSVASDANWAPADGGALMNGFGADEASNDWLLSPALDFSSTNAEELTFDLAVDFSGPALAVQVSTDYSGSGDPTAANWTEVGSFSSPGTQTVDLSGVTGNSNVYVAFQYTSTGTGGGDGAEYVVDNVAVTSTNASTLRFQSASVSAAEDGGSADVTVELAGVDATSSISVDVAFDAGNSTASGQDVDNYSTQTVTFAAGASVGATETVTVLLDDDGNTEGNEDAVFVLQNLTTSGSASIGTANTLTLTIVDDDRTIAQARSDARAGTTEEVILEGTVTRAFGEFARMQDNSGATGASAIVVRQSPGPNPFQQDILDGTIQPGTQLRVQGTLSDFAGLIQINGADLTSYSVLGQSRAPAPQEVTLSTLEASGEDYESELVSVAGVTFPTATGTFASGTNYDVTDGTATLTLRVQGSDESTLAGEAIPTSAFTYEGVVGQFNNFGGIDGDTGYQLIPIQSETALPVELTAFNVTVSETTASLDWQTASEQNNAGFEVQHKAAGSTAFARAGFVDGNGTTPQAQTYRFEVSGLAPGTHTFRLKQVDFDGTESFSPAQEVTVRTGETLAIQGPNPMRGNQQARLVVQVDAEQPVDVALYNVLGQRVATLFTGTATPQAPAEATLSTDRLASGVYFVRVVGASVQATEQITVVR